jgi:hypothetical protein
VKMQNYLHVLHHRITIFIVSSPWLMQSSTWTLYPPWSGSTRIRRRFGGES